jgi:tetratricopeptide (TPR) repeat protein
LYSALVLRYRETGTADYLLQARETLQPELEKDPNAFEPLKLKTVILLEEKKFEEALPLAESLNKRVPDDIPTYGLVADAYIGLKKYDEADKAAQWMFDMRPPTPLAYARGAALREAWNDLDGAADFCIAAIKMIPAQETSERAFWLARLARLEAKRGRPSFAESYAKQALQLLPDLPEANQILATAASRP